MPSIKPGPSVRVVTDRRGFLIVSSPHPIHRGSLVRNTTLGRWIFVCQTAGVRSSTHRTLPEAISHAGLIIGTLYRTDMRARFTGPQRLAMGRTQCPAHVSCRDAEECSLPSGHVHLCKAVPGPVSVWCERHGPVMERGTG